MFRRPDRRDKADGPDDVREAAADEDLESPDDLDGAELGEEVSGDQPEDMTADLESQAADYLADNDVWMYGPNAEAVLEILDRLEEIVPDEARPLAEAWLAIPSPTASGPGRPPASWPRRTWRSPATSSSQRKPSERGWR